MQPVDLDDIRRRLAHLRVESERIRVVAAGITEVRYHSTIGSPTTALLVDPDTTPVATALIVHPATGDRTSLLEDATALAHHGVRCLLPELPRERSDTVALGVESRVRAIETLCAGLEWLRRSDPVPRAIGYIGKNLGGALAGAVCAIDTRVTATVAVAPLPDIGRFFTDATHPRRACTTRTRRPAHLDRHPRRDRTTRASRDHRLVARHTLADPTWWKRRLGPRRRNRRKPAPRRTRRRDRDLRWRRP